MQIVSAPSKVSKIWIAPSDIFTPLFLLATALVAHGNVYAQEPSDDPEALFYELIDQNVPLDDAKNEVANRFGETAAIDIAVYLCSPPPDPACEGSEALAAWHGFVDSLYEGSTAAEGAQDLIADDFDKSLVIGILDYWCGDEPGPGCSDTAPQAPLMDSFVGELLAETECEDPSCYSQEDESPDQPSQPEQQVSEQPASRASAWQYANQPKRQRNRVRGR